MAEYEGNKYVKLAKEMGLEGKEKTDFIREQIAAERAERQRERDLAREAEAEIKRREIEAQAEEKRRKDEADRILTQAKIDQENERMRLDHELKMAQMEVNVRQSRSRDNDVEINNEQVIDARRYRVDVGRWSSGSDLEAFLIRFETCCKAYHIPDELWAIELARALEGESLSVYETLAPEKRLNYDEDVKLLKTHFKLSEHGYRTKFKTSRPIANERQSEFAERLRKYLQNRLNMAGYDQTYEGLEELIVRDAYFLSQPPQVQTYLREAGKLRLKDQTVRAQNYIEAHGLNRNPNNTSGGFRNSNDRNPGGKFQSQMRDGRDNQTRNQNQGNHNSEPNVGSHNLEREPKPKFETKCWICGKIGHKAFACKQSQGQGTNNFQGQNANNGFKPRYNEQAAACKVIEHYQYSEDQIGENLKSVEQIDLENHENIQERYVQLPGDSEKLPVVAAVRADASRRNFEDNNNIKKPLAGEALCNGIPCEYLRDTGSTISICRDNFVDDDQYTGRHITCALVDGCIRTFPEAEVIVESPYYVGPLKVAVISTALHELIIGNDVCRLARAVDETKEGQPPNEPINCDQKVYCKTLIFENSQLTESANNGNWKNKDRLETIVEENDDEGTNQNPVESVVKTHNAEHENAAVQTRSQKAIDSQQKPPKPLKVSKVEGLNITVEEFKERQKNDEKLRKYWDWAKGGQKTDGSETDFVIENDILYRIKQGSLAESVKQLVIPTSLEERVIAYSHESLLSGHLGIQSTINKLLSEFFVLGYHTKVKRYVKSCDCCQRNGSMNKGCKAPNMKLPIVGEPFEMVYIDLIGEIHPMTTEGHRYILTLVDCATRFPVAVPLKKTDSVTIAEALLEIWTNFGFPRICYSDNGANLISAAMQEVHALLGIKGQSGPCYRPQANLVERYNSSIKNILRKLTIEQPNHWNKYIVPLLFAMRTTPNSTGYSSFELMYGRSCFTHLTLLKTLWTGETFQPEVKSTYQYVLDLRERIEETCKLAHEELVKTQVKNLRYCNKNAKLRVLKPGDLALVMIPVQSNHLFFSWKGPAKVLARIGVTNYRILLPSGQERTYHINMLKKYEVRNKEDLNKAVEETEESTDVEQRDEVEEVMVVNGVVEESDEENDEDNVVREEVIGKRLRHGEMLR